ncbi:MAG: carboxypeptidase regulatory-like domain-containing protein [Acidobacteriota bacterium]|nr:carboxypeptidase regulatory-like domain-containing protein [Acidobacteriota bacterium]
MRQLFLLFTLALTARAQSITGAIAGTVSDQTDATVAGSSIRLTSAATGAERTTKTNESGRFFFGSLQPGNYTLDVEAQGFRRLERTSVNVSAAETLGLTDLKLEVGQVTDSVQVKAQAVNLQTETAERAGVLTTSQVQNLAIRGRNVTSLVSLLPGVVDLDDPESLAVNWNFNVQGNRRNTNNVTIDGATVNAIGNNFNSVVAVSMDAVAEVKVLLSNYQAEYGRLSGANVSIVTKSGTREFHGLASYFKRNEALNANDFFNNRLGRPRPRYRFDTWNYQLGGPVYIPGRFNRNKDKLFFFWSQEFWPLSIPTALTQRTTPTDLERRGDFSQSFDVNNALIVVRDPFNNRNPFPGNVIPANRIDPNGQALLKFLPLPNFTNRAVSRGNYNYVFQDIVDQPKRTDTFKLDYNLNSSNLFTFSYSARNDINDGKVGIPAGTGNYDVVRQRSENFGKLYLIRNQKIFSPTLINEFNGSYSTRPLNNSIAPADLKSIQRDGIGFKLGQLHPEINPLGIIPNMSFGGVPNAVQVSFDNRTPLTTTHEIISISDNLTKTLASHTLKFGVYFDQLWAENQATSGQFNGEFNFGRNVNNPLETDYAFANAILGVFNQYDEPTGRPYPVNYASNREWFAQDTWKVNRRFSLDFGARFQWLPQSWVDGDALAGFSADAYSRSQAVNLIQPVMQGATRLGRNPNTGEIVPATMIGAIAPGRGTSSNGMISPLTDKSVPRSLMNEPGVVVAPRAGFAWDLEGNGKTAIRGGFGLFYNRMSHGVVLTDYSVQPPLVNRPTLFFGSMSNLLSSPGALFPANVLGLDRNARIPSVMNFSLSVQRDIGYSTVVDVGYVGSLGRHLLWQRNLNAIPFGTNFSASANDPTTNRPLPPNFLRPYPGYGDITLREPSGSSNYHSLQASANRRFSRNLQFQVSYTWSKSLDYTSDDGNNVSTLVPLRIWNYGLSTFDRTHVVKANWLYDLPGWKNAPKAAAFITNGWQISGIFTASSGAPLGVGYSTVNPVDTTGSPTDGARVQLTGTPVLPRGERIFDRYFNTSAFAQPAAGTFGNAARSVIRGPGIDNWDLTAYKNFSFRDRVRTQLRGEFYNAFNHTQWSSLDTTARFDGTGRQVNTQFGQVTATRPGRRIQLALRILF